MTATLALVLAVAGGTAFAVDKITSHDIARNTIRSLNLKNHKAVRGKDVVQKSIKGRQIDESTLSTEPLIRVAGHETGTECVLRVTPRNCVAAIIGLSRPSDLLVITTGNQRSVGANSKASCRIAIDGAEEALSVAPGEAQSVNTDINATNGFARTLMSRFPVEAGRHMVALRCQRLAGQARIDEPTIGVIAVATG